MRANIPINIQHIWQLYNCIEGLLSFLWETYQDDFMEYYFPEVTGEVQPQTESDFLGTEDFNDDDIPF